jgi:hypothetical protein
VPDDLAVDHLLTVQLSLRVASTSSYPAVAPGRPIIPVIPFRPVVTTSPPRVGPEKRDDGGTYRGRSDGGSMSASWRAPEHRSS